MQKRVLIIFVGAAILYLLLSTFQQKNLIPEPSATSLQKEAENSSAQVHESINKPESTKHQTLTAQLKNSSEPNPFHSRTIPQNPMRQPSQQQFPKSEELVSHPLFANSKWLIWKNTIAVPRKNFSGQNSEILGQASGFVYLYDEQQKINLENFTPERPLVLYNSRLRQTGILTGTIKVAILDRNLLDAFLHDHQAQLIGEFPEIKTYFITSRYSPFPIQDFFQEIKNDERVQNCEFEILSKQYEK